MYQSLYRASWILLYDAKCQSKKIRRRKNTDSIVDCPDNSILNLSIRFLGLFWGCIVEYQDIYKLSVQIVV